MASIEDIQQQLVRNHDQIAALSTEVGTLNAKVSDLHSRCLQKDQRISDLETANQEMQQAGVGNDHHTPGRSGFGLIDSA